jgi:hypothetical protein
MAQQAESSASRQRSEHGQAGAPCTHDPNPPPPSHEARGEGAGAATSAVRSHLGPHRDAWNSIKACQGAERFNNNNHDNRSRHNNDRGCGRRHDSDDGCERSWSPNQRSPQAFGRSICDANFPSRFRALTNVP